MLQQKPRSSSTSGIYLRVFFYFFLLSQKSRSGEKKKNTLRYRAEEAINARKAKKLYACIDASEVYQNKVDIPYRSRMNVVFRLADEKLDARFLEEARAAGLSGLKGDSAVGGMRASIYNAMPEAGVDALIDFMRIFEKKI
jgi:phosphoserine aminotransferase